MKRTLEVIVALILLMSLYGCKTKSYSHEERHIKDTASLSASHNTYIARNGEVLRMGELDYHFVIERLDTIGRTTERLTGNVIHKERQVEVIRDSTILRDTIYMNRRVDSQVESSRARETKSSMWQMFLLPLVGGLAVVIISVRYVLNRTR